MHSDWVVHCSDSDAVLRWDSVSHRSDWNAVQTRSAPDAVPRYSRVHVQLPDDGVPHPSSDVPGSPAVPVPDSDGAADSVLRERSGMRDRINYYCSVSDSKYTPFLISVYYFYIIEYNPSEIKSVHKNVKIF